MALRSEAAAAVVALLVVTWAERGHAGGPVGPNGSKKIQTSEYALDLFSGPVFAGSRVTGLAGAYVAISEDVDGDQQNPATPAVRPFFSYNHFDYWLGFGLTFPASLENTDFFNSGSKTHIANSPDSFVFLTPALNLQWGEFGIGITVEMQHYQLSQVSETTGLRTAISAPYRPRIFRSARGFDHNQWVFGVGARYASISVLTPDQHRSAFTSSGTGLEFGGSGSRRTSPFARDRVPHRNSYGGAVPGPTLAGRKRRPHRARSDGNPLYPKPSPARGI